MANSNSTEASQGTSHEYARSQLCFHDHQGAPFRFRDQISQLQTTIQPVQSDGLIHQSGLTTASLPFPVIDLDPTGESDQLPTGFHPSSPEPVFDSFMFTDLGGLSNLRIPSESLDLGVDLKQEFRQYLTEIHMKSTCNLSNEWLPLSPVDISKDEGLSLSSTSSRWQSLALRELEHGTLEVPEEAHNLVLEAEGSGQSTYPQWLDKVDLGLEQRSRVALEPVSPPLSPIFIPDSPFIPSPRITVVDLTSEPSSPVNSTVEKLQQTFQDGSLDSDPVAPSIFESSPPALDSLTCSNTTLRTPSRLKVDVPAVSSSCSVEDNIDLSGPGLLGEYVHEEAEARFAGSESLFDEALQLTIEERHHRATEMIDGERLDLSDSQLRFPVPVLSFDIPEPGWMSLLSTPNTHFDWLQTVYPASFQLPPETPGAQLGSSLKWVPIPHGRGQVELNEKLDRLGTASRAYLTLECPRLSSASYISEPRSLSILRISDEEEIEDEPSSLDCSNPLMPEESHTNIPGPASSSRINPPDSLLNGGLLLTSQSRKRKPTNGSSDLLPCSNDSSTTSKLLSTFIQLQQPKRFKVAEESLADRQPAPGNTTRHQPSPQVSLSGQHQSTQENRELHPAPAPEFVIPKEKCRFIISLGLSRSVLSKLDELWPQADLVDRDFAQHNTTTWSPGSAKRKKVVSSLSYEADISLSPSAGIIVTTVLKVKQKPLPGSTSLTPLRERLQRVSEEYESLFVLVSEANPDGEYVGTQGTSDMAAYADFVRFCVALQAGVTVYFISGADDTLTKWIASLMCRFAPQSTRLGHFLESRDTTWGLFFRRAGLNVVAAQVLAGLLFSEHGKLGLARFLTMSAKERKSAYAQVLGGERVLGNVCRVLDHQWM
ncbi:hypothetical protein G7046_g9826 [Stylonectria norvegica]|nr:hypothetical protein G7046_g9826 [Stylonectria norvegica]